MRLVDFTTKPVAPLPNPFTESDLTFRSVSRLEVKSPGSGGKGLAFVGFTLDIEFAEPTSLVIMQMIVFNPTAIEALDNGYVAVAPPQVFPPNAGSVVVLFDVGTPLVRRIRVLGGERENLLEKMRAL